MSALHVFPNLSTRAQAEHLNRVHGADLAANVGHDRPTMLAIHIKCHSPVDTAGLGSTLGVHRSNDPRVQIEGAGLMPKFGTHTGEFEAWSEVDQILHLNTVHKQLPVPRGGWGTFSERTRGHDRLHSPEGQIEEKVALAMTAEFEHRLFHVLEEAFDAGVDHSVSRDPWIEANFPRISAVLRGLGYQA